MPQIKSFDHIGVTVVDLEAAIDFFVRLGLELEGRTYVEGEFLDTVCGIPDARTEVAMLVPPGGGCRLEICRFVRPDTTPGNPGSMANEVGLRNVCFEITDLEEEIARLADEGYGLVGGIGRYEDQWLMAYVRGPEGIVVSLTERIG